MAFGSDRDRTIVVKTATTRDISDVAGFNWLKPKGEYDSRFALKVRLARAGVAVRVEEYALRGTLSVPFRLE